MISLWFGTEKPSEYYLPKLHGRVFTRTEILSIVEAKGLPEQEWETNLPSHLAPYIEAQVWNQQPLRRTGGGVERGRRCPPWLTGNEPRKDRT